MKRPFALIGFTSFAVLLVPAFIGRSDVAFCALCCFLLGGICSLFVKKTRQAGVSPVFFFTAVFACLLFLLFFTDKAQVQSLQGEGVRVEATVCEAPYMKTENSRHYVVCRLKNVNGQKVKGKIRISFSPEKDGIDTENLLIGNSIAFTGKVYIPGGGEKDIERYFTGENILLGAYGVKNFTFTEPTIKPVTYYFYKLRSFTTEKLRYLFADKRAGVLTGILTADKSCLDDTLYESFKNSGVAHLMAVSGLHLSVWVFFLGGVIPENGKATKLKYILLIFAVIFIMLLSGMSESVKRAGFMALVFLFGKLSKRKSDSLNSLGLAVFLMILYNPMCVLSISLQLSFLSTLSILTLGKQYINRSGELLGSDKINTLPRKLLRLCLNSFCISISVLIFTFPVLIYAFGGISTVSAWTNMLLIPVTTPLLVLTGVCVIFSSVSCVAYPLSLVIKLFTDYLIGITGFFAGFDNAFLLFQKDNYLLYFAAALLVTAFSVAVLKNHSKKVKLFLTLTVVAATLMLVLNRVI